MPCTCVENSLPKKYKECDNFYISIVKFTQVDQSALSPVDKGLTGPDQPAAIPDQLDLAAEKENREGFINILQTIPPGE